MEDQDSSILLRAAFHHVNNNMNSHENPDAPVAEMANERGWLIPKIFFFCTLLMAWNFSSYVNYVFGLFWYYTRAICLVVCVLHVEKINIDREMNCNCCSEGRILPCDADTLFPRNSIQRRNLDPFPMTTQQPPSMIVILDSRLVPPPLFHTSQRRLAPKDFLLELPAALLHMWRAACPQVTCPLSCVWHARALGVPRSHHTRSSLLFFLSRRVARASALESRDRLLSSSIVPFLFISSF